jgi:hypothetical protein
MTSKTQLQSKIQELEAELQSFKQQLNTYTEITIENASVGDVLEDGSIVLKKSNGLALLVAPQSTEVKATWSKEFPEVFEALKEQGFNPSQWFVPTREQLQLAYNNLCDEFSSPLYWSSTDFNATLACNVFFTTGFAYFSFKTYSFCVRAFRCVTY